MNIIEFEGDPNLARNGPLGDPRSWQAWTAIERALYGIPFVPGDRAILRKLTGRTRFDPNGYLRLVVIGGRRCGKTVKSASIVVYEASRGSAGEHANETALLICQDSRAGRNVALAAVKDAVSRSPLLKASVRRERADSIEFETGCTVMVLPCRPSAVRGLTARVAVLDELAHFRSTDDHPLDRDMVRAVEPCLPTTSGRLIMLSSAGAPEA